MSAVPRYETARSEAKTGGFFQGLMCSLGMHKFEDVGLQTETNHRYSESHEAVYLVTIRRTLLRCSCCALETRKVESVDNAEEGHYERVYIRR